MADPMQACRECEVEMPLTPDYFYKDPSRKTGFHIRCKPCHIEFVKRRRTPEKSREWDRNADAKKREWFQSLKSSPCADCGGEFPPYVMDWDHVRGDKVAAVSRLMNRSRGREKVLEEIQKCDLVCANCHRIRTYERGQYGQRAS